MPLPLRQAGESPAQTSPAAGPPSFDRVYRDHVGFVYRQLRRFGVNDADLEDATQEVFVIVNRRLAEFDPRRGALTTWMYGIARGVASNALRSRSRRLAREERAPVPLAPVRPDAVLESRRAAEVVARFLDTLPDDRRAVFELVEIEGLRASQVAEMLDVKANTVYTRLRAARLAFKTYVADLSGDPAGGTP